jgi:hypothetical protein
VLLRWQRQPDGASEANSTVAPGKRGYRKFALSDRLAD